ncbi:hypothetical protein ACM66B_004395 [Microbotryomycetes sp. NB124-2]
MNSINAALERLVWQRQVLKELGEHNIPINGYAVQVFGIAYDHAIRVYLVVEPIKRESNQLLQSLITKSNGAFASHQRCPFFRMRGVWKKPKTSDDC